MNKPNFTPGPWKVFDDGIAQHTDMVDVVAPWSGDVKAANTATFGDYRGALIATLPYVNSEGSVPTKEQALANARLIAAAPALYAALVDLVRQLPKDERLADFNLDQAEAAVLLVDSPDATTGAEIAGRL